MATAVRPAAGGTISESGVVPIRAQPREPETLDDLRVKLVHDRWSAQDEAYEPIGRMVELNVRMLAGRQWDEWSPLYGRYVNPREYMTEAERKVRQRPVMDYLGYWFMVTLSKVTENLPVVGFLPANLDDHSAKLAEVCDPIFKTLFDECDWSERYALAVSWCLVGGEAYFMTRPDFTEGPERELVGPAMLSLEREDGSLIEREVEAVPFNEDGDPLAELVPMEDAVPGEDGQLPDDAYGYDVTGDPFTDRVGTVRLEVGSVLEVRAEWGTNIPWSQKRWMIHRWFLPPDEVRSRWGVPVEADVYADMDESSPGYLERLLFGDGYFGAAQGEPGGGSSGTNEKARKGYVCGYTMWEKPCADYPQGRLLVVGGKEVLHDSIRPFDTECAGPIRRVQLKPIPGRPVASTPLEIMTMMQKRINRVDAQIGQHSELNTNPMLLKHQDAGIPDEVLVAMPGLVVEHNAPAGVDPLKYVTPGTLSSDVWRYRESLRQQLFTIGSITGNEGASPSIDPSGELVEQLRFNADRPLAPFTRSLEQATAGVCEDMLAILPTVWTEEQVIHYAGEDNAVKTITVLPEMWDGSVSARPVVGSASPESRQERERRTVELFNLGAWGDPKSQDPGEAQKARAKLLEMVAAPHLGRAGKPGGVHRLMAERNLAELLRGAPAEQLPLLMEYDLDVHLDVLLTFIASPDFVSQTFEVQNEMQRHKQHLEAAQVQKQTTLMERAGDLATIESVVAARGMQATAAIVPPPPGAGAGPNGAPQPGPSGPGASPSARPAPSGAAA